MITCGRHLSTFKANFWVLLVCLWSIFPSIVSAQQVYTFKGKITDAESGDPIPFATVYFKGKNTSTQADFDGVYTLRTQTIADSLFAQYIGYKVRAKKIKKGQTSQKVDFELTPSGFSAGEVEIIAGENPAFEIMRRVVINKPVNDIRQLEAFQYQSYNRIEVAVNNISEKFKKRKSLKQIVKLLDSLEAVKGEDGKPILPIFVSEAISEYYAKFRPKLSRERLVKTKVSGVGVDEGSVVTQMVGATFQQFNFYENWIEVATKSFASPLQDGWNLVYDFDLLDSLYIQDEWCYKLAFRPKRDKDLAFIGTMWVAKQDYGIKQLDLTVSKSANINYIDKIKLQQELERTIAGAWVPTKTRILIDIAQLSESWAGMLAKSYTSNKNIKVNIPYDDAFYDPVLEELPDAGKTNDDYWERNRHDTLTTGERKVFKMIDTVRNLPVVRGYVEIANIFMNGYKKIGSVDVGPYLYSYAFNNIEGHRVRLGLRTNSYFNNRFTLEGYGAFGTTDHRFKYSATLSYILNRRRWTVLGITQTEDLEQVAFNELNLSNNQLLYAFSRFGDITDFQPYYNHFTSIFLNTEVTRGLNQTFSLSTRFFEPQFSGFRYRIRPDDPNSELGESFTATEFTYEVKYDPQALFLFKKNNNQRVSVSARFSPIFSFKYQLGIKGLFNGDLGYHKFTFGLQHNIKTGVLGTGRYDIQLAYTPSTLPYSLLNAHLGNQSPIFAFSAYNMMRLFEFVSDRYAMIGYTQYFEGLFFNSIPFVKRAKLRLVAHGKLLMGDVSQRNRNASFLLDTKTGISRPAFRSLGSDPYVEVGYGVENIFKILRFDIIHRLTYLDNPNVRPVGAKLSFQFKL